MSRTESYQETFLLCLTTPKSHPKYFYLVHCVEERQRQSSQQVTELQQEDTAPTATAELSVESASAAGSSAASVDDTEPDGDSAWSHSDTLLLIETYRTHRLKFRDRTRKKKEIWREISQKM